MHIDRLRQIISSLADALAEDLAPRESRESAGLNDDVVRFVEYALVHMTDYLSVPMKTLTFIFDLAGMLHAGVPFHRQPLAVRQNQIRRWRESRIRFCREFIRFYEGLTAYALYSRVSVDRAE